MESLPHIYQVSLSQSDHLVKTDGENAPSIFGGAPPQFGGSPDNWSPELLLMASIGQCLFLTLVSIARASRFAFQSYESRINGKLEKTSHGLAFTSAAIEISFVSDDELKAKKLIEKAEKNCLISNSLNFPVTVSFQHISA